jgi:CYTH domain-containing protein
VTRSLLHQAYLDVSGMRIRSIDGARGQSHVFTYKRPVNGQVVEIETEISREDFDRLSSQCIERLRKVRYAWTEGPFHWDIDFFKTESGDTYFAMAEVEMPEDHRQPPPLPPSLAPHLLATVPAGDPRFQSKRLANRAHAEALGAAILASGRID